MKKQSIIRKKIIIGLVFTLVPMTSMAGGLFGISWSDVDPITIAKKIPKETERTIEDVGKVVAEAAAIPLEATEKTLGAAGDIVGGDVGKKLKKISKETDRAGDDLRIAIKGGANAVAEIPSKPIDSMARIGGCIVTACATEVKAHHDKEKAIKNSIKEKNETISKLKSNFSNEFKAGNKESIKTCLLYTSPSPRDQRGSRMPSSA